MESYVIQVRFGVKIFFLKVNRELTRYKCEAQVFYRYQAAKLELEYITDGKFYEDADLCIVRYY